MSFLISIKSKILNNFIKTIKLQIDIEPPITAEINGLNAYKDMLEIKCPKMLDGTIINEYLKDV